MFHKNDAWKSFHEIVKILKAFICRVLASLTYGSDNFSLLIWTWHQAVDYVYHFFIVLTDHSEVLGALA